MPKRLRGIRKGTCLIELVNYGRVEAGRVVARTAPDYAADVGWYVPVTAPNGEGFFLLASHIRRCRRRS